MIKFSLIMPTYNDAISIVETLDSIISQTYKNWELIIIDDGSKDNTKELIKKYTEKYDIENRINYYYQENADQLNAILNACDKIKGNYIYVIHSDDLFANDNVLSKIAKEIESYPDYDAFLSKGSYIINETSEIIGKQNFLTYRKKKSVLPLELLWLGRNIYWDLAVCKKEIFLTEVKNNYLIWNTPFWINTEKKPYMLNVKTLNFYFTKYRVFEGNYINNIIGKLNVLNGELRLATRLMKYYRIPFYKLQYLIFRIFNKLKLSSIYKPIYVSKETNNKSQIVDFIIKKRFAYYENYLFLKCLYNFYKNYKNRKIIIKKIDSSEEIFVGADIRKFNNQMIKGTLSKFYQNLLKEMNKGFNTIITTEENYNKILTTIKFLCIYPFVNIEIEENKQ